MSSNRRLQQTAFPAMALAWSESEPSHLADKANFEHLKKWRNQ